MRLTFSTGPSPPSFHLKHFETQFTDILNWIHSIKSHIFFIAQSVRSRSVLIFLSFPIHLFSDLQEICGVSFFPTNLTVLYPLHPDVALNRPTKQNRHRQKTASFTSYARSARGGPLFVLSHQVLLDSHMYDSTEIYYYSYLLNICRISTLVRAEDSDSFCTGIHRFSSGRQWRCMCTLKISKA